uniref:Bm14314 n=1 Tax=Brugia malayi TaxID=6279 RepID=A0A0J9Y305_BRUMA|nr:Bm14314 [Brugia malayi]
MTILMRCPLDDTCYDLSALLRNLTTSSNTIISRPQICPTLAQ